MEVKPGLLIWCWRNRLLGIFLLGYVLGDLNVDKVLVLPNILSARALLSALPSSWQLHRCCLEDCKMTEPPRRCLDASIADADEDESLCILHEGWWAKGSVCLEQSQALGESLAYPCGQKAFLRGIAAEKSKAREIVDALCRASSWITSLISNPSSLHALLNDCKTPWSISYRFVSGVRIAHCSYCFKAVEQRNSSKCRLVYLWPI